MKKLLTNYEKACQDIADYIHKEYYDSYEYEYYWVSDDIGGVLVIGDEYLNMTDMIDILRYKPTPEQWRKYYWDKMDAYWIGEPFPKLKDWLKNE